MKKIAIIILTLLATGNAIATEDNYGTSYFPGMELFPKVRAVEHKKELNPDFKPSNLMHDSNKFSDIKLSLITKADPEGKNLSWSMALPFRYVFLSRFAMMERAADDYVAPDDIWGRDYKHLKITFDRPDGQTMPPYYLYKNTITVNNITYVDNRKEIEDWVFSTVNNYKQLEFVNKALKIDNYERCKNAGNLYHETSPEQCVFPDGTTFLNLNTEIKEDTIRTFNFDDCFANKNPLISGFPRRCIAPGGHVYTEDPKVK